MKGRLSGTQTARKLKPPALNGGYLLRILACSRMLLRQLASSQVQSSGCEPSLAVAQWPEGYWHIVQFAVPVAGAPRFGDLAHVLDRIEPVRRQRRLAVGSAKTFDEHVLVRLNRPDEMDLDSARLASFVGGIAGQCRAVVSAKYSRRPVRLVHLSLCALAVNSTGTSPRRAATFHSMATHANTE